MDRIGKPLLQVLRKERPERRPIWLMRQAGRYLPEYRELRKKAGTFLDFCLTPDLAAEATLQPLQRFDLDAAILFADILLVPHAMGQKIVFKENIGPVLEAIAEEELFFQPEKLAPVYETLRKVKERIDPAKTLIGFSGGLWSVACYMIQGDGKNGFAKVKKLAEESPDRFSDLIDRLFSVTVFYLKKQIAAGAEVIQIFESHAGMAEKDETFERFILEPTKKLVDSIHADYPDFPIIGFPRGASVQRKCAFFKQTGVTALSVDQDMTTDEILEIKRCGLLQGNLDPKILVRGGAEMRKEAEKIMKLFGQRHIFNLGHGVLPETNPENVRELVDFVHAYGFPK